jgi:hypothetical protein
MQSFLPGKVDTELNYATTVGSPQIGHPPIPDKPVALRTYSASGTKFGCMTARPSPQKPVT